MNCSAFESALTALAAGEVAEDRRELYVERLRQHAVGCDGCRGTIDMLDLLGRPPGERDLVSDPGPAYWASFDDRLRARIAAADAAPGKTTSPAPRRWLPWAAAVLAVIGLAGGALRFWRAAPQETTELTWLIAENMTHDSGVDPVDLPGELAAMLKGLSVEQAADALSGLAGLETAWEWPLRDASDADLDALLSTVDDWEQITLLEDWLPAAGAESLAAEAGVAGFPGGAWTPFPDARPLQGAARKEFLRWLSESTSPPPGGVS